jgi:ATP-dependent Clp protease ATP-binding subunit ClpA
MAFEKFTRAARAATTDATTIARELGSPVVEAEHLLLAASRADDPAGAALRSVGLDYEGLSAALAEETQRSLAAVGVSVEPLAFAPFVASPRFGTSAKLALERSLQAALAKDVFGERRQRNGILLAHVVLGVLRAKRGTVPRALAGASIDPQDLVWRVTATI